MEIKVDYKEIWFKKHKTALHAKCRFKRKKRKKKKIKTIPKTPPQRDKRHSRKIPANLVSHRPLAKKVVRYQIVHPHNIADGMHAGSV